MYMHKDACTHARAYAPLQVRTELTLTPLPSDAGADMTFDYPNNPLGLELPLGPDPSGSGGDRAPGASEQAAGRDSSGWELLEKDLPVRGWPAPTLDMWSPFGSGSR